MLRTIDADGDLADVYNAMERDELSQRARVFEWHPREIAAWLEGLSLVHQMLSFGWPTSSKYPDRDRLQVGLAGLALSASKSAFDATVGSNYPVAFASARLGYESAFMIMALQLLPERALEWYRDPELGEPRLTSPSVTTVMRQIRKVITPQAQSALPLAERWEKIIHDTAVGAHPTRELLLALFTDDPGEMRLSRYSDQHALLAFKFGLYLNSALITAAEPPRLARMLEQERGEVLRWQVRAHEWQRSIGEVDKDLALRILEISGQTMPDAPDAMDQRGD